MPEFANNPIVVIFLGTLPVLAGILWGVLQNKEQFGLIQSRLERMEERLDKIDVRLAVVETRLEGPKLVGR